MSYVITFDMWQSLYYELLSNVFYILYFLAKVE